MTMQTTSEYMIEGISNELLVAVFVFVAIVFGFYILTKVYKSTSIIHPSNLQQVQAIRERFSEHRDENAPPRRSPHGEDAQCPICIDTLSLAVETNCGHVFCCEFIDTIYTNS